MLFLNYILLLRTMPNPSPFVLKVETYLRAMNIKYFILNCHIKRLLWEVFFGKTRYVVDTSVHTNPSKKSPWLTCNGQDIIDRQVNVETKFHDLTMPSMFGYFLLLQNVIEFLVDKFGVRNYYSFWNFTSLGTSAFLIY